MLSDSVLTAALKQYNISSLYVGLARFETIINEKESVVNKRTNNTFVGWALDALCLPFRVRRCRIYCFAGLNYANAFSSNGFKLRPDAVTKCLKREIAETPNSFINCESRTTTLAINICTVSFFRKSNASGAWRFIGG